MKNNIYDFLKSLNLESIDKGVLLFAEQLHSLGLLNDEVNKYILLDVLSDIQNGNLLKEYSELLDPSILQKQFTKSPFDVPDESVDGPIRVAVAEGGASIGFFPEECHFLISGQTGTGKSTLLKIIFVEALLFNERQG